MKKIAMFLLVLIASTIGCGGKNEMQGTVMALSIDNLSSSDFSRLSSKRFYFGHQSVGDNMMDGIQKILQRDDRLKLKIIKINDMKFPDDPAFVHFDVGINDDPISKIVDFNLKVQKGWGEIVDVAMFKFCFWDIRSDTDIGDVFRKYKGVMTELHAKYPKLKIVHFTVPLMRYENGLMTRLKRTVGGNVESDVDNIKRNELNNMILQEYKGKEPVFDIALAEATLPNGKYVYFSRNGKSYYYLAEEYTKDGGHLNEAGRLHVAEQFLLTLADVVKD